MTDTKQMPKAGETWRHRHGGKVKVEQVVHGTVHILWPAAYGLFGAERQRKPLAVFMADFRPEVTR